MKTIVAVPDFTRDAHLKKVLPGIINKLNKIGVHDKNIEILIATGLHRSPAKKEIAYHIGNTARRIRVSVHDYKNIFYLATSKRRIPIYMDAKLKDAESIITVGVVEPHLYAGYSGGVKVVAIGLAGEKTINATHHPRFLDHPGTRICSVYNNPFQDFIQEAASMLPIKHSVNIVNDENGKMLRAFEGKPLPCFKKAVGFAQKIFEKRLDTCLDVVICGMPCSKGANIYQASRAFNYVANTRQPVIKHDSIILAKAGLEEGFGKGLGERRFMKKVLAMKSPEKLIAEIKKGGCLAGEHRTYMTAKALIKARLGFISGKAYLYKNKGLPFLFFKDLGEARKYLKEYFKRKPGIYYLKNAFSAILTKT